MPRAALGLYVAVMLVVGQLAALFHLALVEHDVCTDHGELMYADAAPAAEEPRADGPLVAPAEGDHGLAHEHCNSLARQGETVAVPDAEARFAVIAAAENTSAVKSYVTRARSQRSALVVAPKQSPPLV